MHKYCKYTVGDILVCKENQDYLFGKGDTAIVKSLSKFGLIVMVETTGLRKEFSPFIAYLTFEDIDTYWLNKNAPKKIHNHFRTPIFV